jgi:PAS domain-containing protein
LRKYIYPDYIEITVVVLYIRIGEIAGMGKNYSDDREGSFSDKSSDYYLHLLENSKDIIFYLMNAKTGKFEYVSSATTEISGFTPEEIIEMGMEGISKRVHPDDHRTVEKKIMEVLADKLPPSNFAGYIEQRFKHKKGHWVWFSVNRNFITGANGKIEAVVGNIRDITEIKLLQQNLGSSLEDYKSLYDNARVALYRVRIGDGKLIECNETLVKLLGYENKEQCLAKHYASKSYADPRRRDELMKLLKEKEQVDDFELETWRVDGSVLWIKISVRMYPEKGYLEGAIWDITASKILTPTENKILELVMQGKSNKEIAFQLKRSIRTIEDHRAHIMQKLDAHNLVELTKKAIDSGIAPGKI